eukprot:721649_1
MGKKNARQLRRKRARELRGKEQAFGFPSNSEQGMRPVPDVDVTVQTDAPRLLEQLRSTKPHLRVTACATVANMVSGARGARACEFMLTNGFLDPLLACAFDKECSLRVVAVGALRNIASSDYADACAILVKADTLTTCFCLLGQTVSSTTIDPSLRISLLTQLMALSCSLAENSDLTIGNFSKNSNLVECAWKCLDPEHCPMPLLVETAQFLNTATEDNEPLACTIRANANFITQCRSLAESEAVCLQVRALAAGILMNVSDESSTTEAINIVLPAIHSILSADLVPILKAMGPSIETEQKKIDESQASACADGSMDTSEDSKSAPKSETKTYQQPPDPWVDTIDLFRQNALGIQSALELLTNISALEGNGDSVSSQMDNLWNSQLGAGLFEKVSNFTSSFDTSSSDPACLGSLEHLRRLTPQRVFTRVTGVLSTLRRRACRCLANI